MRSDTESDPIVSHEDEIPVDARRGSVDVAVVDVAVM